MLKLKLIGPLLTVGLLCPGSPVFANGSNGQVGDNPNATATEDLCYRHPVIGAPATIVCRGERADRPVYSYRVGESLTSNSGFYDDPSPRFQDWAPSGGRFDHAYSIDEISRPSAEDWVEASYPY